jgi:Lipocalin-like domain
MMKIRLVVALVVLAISFAVPAFSQQKTPKELIVGAWLLDSVYDQTQDGEKHNPWGDGVKGQAIFTSDGHFSWEMMSANRPKADTSPREPVGQVVAEWGTYTVDDAAKTYTVHVERCTFPQWDGNEGTLNLAFPTENELNITTTKPIPDPKMGPFVPHMNWKRAPAASAASAETK